MTMLALRNRSGARRASAARRHAHIWLQSLEARITPTIFIVTNTLDSGPGSLRQAVLDSNATPGLDTTVFNIANAGAINVTSGPLVVTDPLSIDGTNLSGRKISGQNKNQIFVFSIAGIGAESSFNDLSLANGVSYSANGGAISLDNDALRLTRVTISNCIAPDGAAVYLADGKLTVEDSTFASNISSSVGGAIAARLFSNTKSSNQMIIRRSSFSGNRARSGGAIYFNDPRAGSSFLIQSSTISNNTANAGLSSNPSVAAGGIWAYASSLSVVQCTVSGNSATAFGAQNQQTFAGGLLLTSFGNSIGTINLVNCTITNNTAGTVGGVYVNGPHLVFSGNVVAQNDANSFPDLKGMVNTKTLNGGGNIIGSYSGPALYLTGQNLIGTPSMPIDAKLAPLALNGGTTKTHLPLPGSPVFNRGENILGLTDDQRGGGFSRVLDDAPDAGAVESAIGGPVAAGEVANVTVAGVSSQVITVTYFDDAAIDVSTLGTSDIVINGPGGFTATPVFLGVDVDTSGTPRTATYSFTPPGGNWDASDNGNYTVNQVAGQVFDTDNPTPTSAPAITLASFGVLIPRILVVDHAVDEFDGITSPGQMSLREAVAIANASLNTPDTITFDPTVFAMPTTIALTLGQILISDGVTIDGPTSPLIIDGGMTTRIFYITIPDRINQLITLRQMTLADGFMSGYADGPGGGGILLENESLNLDHITIRNCHALSSAGGGAVESESAQAFTATDCVFLTNSASGANGHGGALDSTNDFSESITLSRCLFAGNYAGGRGGAVCNTTAPTNIVDCTFTGNSANGPGGAIALKSETFSSIRNSTISGNTATQGGGVYSYVRPLSSAFVDNCTVVNNTATANGGGINVIVFSGVDSATSSMTVSSIRNCTISGNSASQGGGFYFYGILNSSTFVDNCTIANNTANTKGGGICVGSFPGAAAIGSLIAGNASPTGPDAAGKLMANSCLVGNPADATITGSNNLFNLNPMLAPLANYGGPTTTMALLAGSPCINAGAPITGIATDQRGYARTYGSAPDIGAYELQPPRVDSVVINDGSAQRSRVTSVTVNFDSLVAVMPRAFQLQRQSDGKLVDVFPDFSVGGPTTSVTLSFSGALTEFGSLKDGRYTLTVFGTQVSNFVGSLDGNGDSVPGDDYVLASSGTTGVFRLFGDINGDGAVAANDLIAFRQHFGGYLFAFDFDSDGSVSANDFLQFRLRFGGSI
jgi:hypothetical protein